MKWYRYRGLSAMQKGDSDERKMEDHICDPDRPVLHFAGV